MQGGSGAEAAVEEAGEKRGQDPDLVTAAIFHGNIMCSISQQLSRPASPTNSFAIGELWQGQLNLTLSDVSIQGSAGSNGAGMLDTRGLQVGQSEERRVP